MMVETGELGGGGWVVMEAGGFGDGSCHCSAKDSTGGRAAWWQSSSSCGHIWSRGSSHMPKFRRKRPAPVLSPQLLRFPCSLRAGAPGKYRGRSACRLPDVAVGKEETRALPSGVLNLAVEE